MEIHIDESVFRHEDDAKQKFQSHELHYDLMTHSGMSHLNLRITAYGSDKQEAWGYFKRIVTHLNEQIQLLEHQQKQDEQ